MNAQERTAQFIHDLVWEDVPEPVRRTARMCLVDSAGATLAGTVTRVSQIGADYAAATWPGEEATILLHGRRASPVGAAFANGCASNAIDIDDSARYAYGHAGAQIFPTALAVAEAEGLSGAEMLAGMVVGYEVAHRVGRCWHASRSVYQGCGSWGSVACAAVAAHLMHLLPAQAAHALGIAEYHAPNIPMMRDVDHPAMVKHGVPWAAMTGVISAGLARRGFTGIPGILTLAERPATGGNEFQEWGRDIGEHFLMADGVAWKSEGLAFCGWAHAGVLGAQRLVEQYRIPLDEIVHIRVEGNHGTASLPKGLPTTTEEAQFNEAWPLAAMLLDGEVGPAQMLEERLADPRIRSLAQKVEVVETRELEHLRELFEQGDPRGRFAGRVVITLADGREVDSGLVDSGLSFPPSGWDQERMSHKFEWLAATVLPETDVQPVLETLWRFERLTNVREWTSGLAPAVRGRNVPPPAGMFHGMFNGARWTGGEARHE